MNAFFHGNQESWLGGLDQGLGFLPEKQKLRVWDEA